MLRRAEKIVLKDDFDFPQQDSEPEPSRSEGPRLAIPKAERQNLDALRAEFQKSLQSDGEERSYEGLRRGVKPRFSIPPSRLILVAVALLAGGIAGYLALSQDKPAPPPVVETAKPVEAPVMQVLVAKAAIPPGTRLTADSLEWIDWPEKAVRAEYVTNAAAPEAMTEMVGALARAQFYPGEPIREEKLSKGGEGYLSAILASGMRGVSVPIDAESASGGFIVPGDHVDVVLTKNSDVEKDAATLLQNVTVLAINANLGGDGASAAPAGEASTTTFADHAIATLALDPTQAEVIIGAMGMGKLSLALRPTGDVADAATAAERAANAAIRMTSPFWTVGAGLKSDK